MAGVLNILLMVILVLFSLMLVGIPIAIYYFAIFFGAPKRIAKAERKLENTLMHDEAIITQGKQQRLFAFFSCRKLVSITNSRIIMISRGLLGGFTMQDFHWKICMMQKSQKTYYLTYVVQT